MRSIRPLVKSIRSILKNIILKTWKEDVTIKVAGMSFGCSHCKRWAIQIITGSTLSSLEPFTYIHLSGMHKGESKSYFRSSLESSKTSQSLWNLLAPFLSLTSTASLLKSVILVKPLKGMSRGFQWLQRTLVKLAVLISIQRLGFGEGGGQGDAESMRNYQ